MPEFTAAVFASRHHESTGTSTLIAHGLLHEGNRAYWEIHISDKIFRFIPSAAYLLEDGLWQLHNYCFIPESEYRHDVHYNPPLHIEEEFGKATCNQARKALPETLKKSGIRFQAMLIAAADPHRELKNRVLSLQQQGAPIQTTFANA
jgi:hypothetical protein